MTIDIRSEAAIWAEGTKYSTDDIVRSYRAYLAECEERGVDADDIQTFCQRDLEIPNEDATDDNTLLCEATADQLDRVRAAATAAGHPGLEAAVNGDGGSTGLWGWTVARVLEHLTPKSHTWTVRTDASMTEVEAADIDAAAVAWAASEGIAEINGIDSLVRHIESIDGAWLWIESVMAPDGDRVYAGRENMA